MLRWNVFAIVAVCALAAGMLGCSRGPARPNLVVVVIDTLRADHLGSYGWQRAQTPRLDALAAQGTRFAAARAPSSWTLPSVASILTGRYPVEHGAERLSAALSAKHVTIAETLAAAGYETAAFSANIWFVNSELGLAQGFERFDAIEAPPDAKRTNDSVLVRDGTDRGAQAAAADVVTDAVLKWKAARADPSRPYFLYVHYFDPHSSYAPPDAWAARFGVKADDPLLTGGQGMLAFGAALPAEPTLSTLLALYDAEVAFTDAEVGRLFDGLGILGARDTYVIVTSDHGEEFGDHGGLGHGRTLFEEMIRVPLIVAGGDLPSGRVVDMPVSLVSVAATLAELAGATMPAGANGRSLVPVLRNAPAEAETVFAELAPPGAIHRSAAIDDTWKLILTRGFAPTLYDLKSDPGERAGQRRGDRSITVPLQKAIGAHNKAGFKARAAAPPEERTIGAGPRERLRQLGYVE